MIPMTCQRCHSPELRKNGTTPYGQQKYHCTTCNFYGTFDTQLNAQARHLKRQQIERLHLERLSQRAIARATHASRRTVVTVLKKSSDPHGDDSRA
jgi:transposase-like protein